MIKNRASEIKPFFIPGSEWLYIKIYTGPKTSDNILSSIIGPMANDLIENSMISKWFFIRYSDPDHHLRIRFHLTSTKNCGPILEELAVKFKNHYTDGLIWNLSVETYVRELSRYGHSSISVFESLFYFNSTMVINFIDNEDELNMPRWLFSIFYIDYFLTLCDFDLDSKFNLLNQMSISFCSEYNISGNYKKPISHKYKENRTQIESLLEESNNVNKAQLNRLFNFNHENEKLLIDNLLKEGKQNKMLEELNQQLRSYIHMFMNRLFTSNNRKYELVCYDFISRYYRSQIARKKNAAN